MNFSIAKQKGEERRAYNQSDVIEGQICISSGLVPQFMVDADLTAMVMCGHSFPGGDPYGACPGYPRIHYASCLSQTVDE